MIRKENLQGDEGNPFKFGTHMFWCSYGVKLTEMHLYDLIIAKLLGHKRTHVVMQYRKMSNQVLADKTRKARAEQTRILLANIDSWGEIMSKYDKIIERNRERSDAKIESAKLAIWKLMEDGERVSTP